MARRLHDRLWVGDSWLAKFVDCGSRRQDEIERQLSHKALGIKGVYKKAQYPDSRRKMMQH